MSGIHVLSVAEDRIRRLARCRCAGPGPDGGRRRVVEYRPRSLWYASRFTCAACGRTWAEGSIYQGPSKRRAADASKHWTTAPARSVAEASADAWLCAEIDAQAEWERANS